MDQDGELSGLQLDMSQKITLFMTRTIGGEDYTDHHLAGNCEHNHFYEAEI